MKTQWLLLTVVGLLFAGSALAQITTPKLAGNVPFDFVVNDKTFPKGEYIVSAFDDGHKLVIQNKNQPEYSAFVLNSDVSLNRYLDSNGKMIFVLTNGQHVLHQIAFRGDKHVHDIVHEGRDSIELVAQR